MTQQQHLSINYKITLSFALCMANFRGVIVLVCKWWNFFFYCSCEFFGVFRVIKLNCSILIYIYFFIFFLYGFVESLILDVYNIDQLPVEFSIQFVIILLCFHLLCLVNKVYNWLYLRNLMGTLIVIVQSYKIIYFFGLSSNGQC